MTGGLSRCASRAFRHPRRCDMPAGGWHQVRPVARTRRAERPVAFQPRADRVVKHRVELRTVRAYPGTDGRIMVTRAGAARALAARRVDVHAADDLAGAGAEHPAAPGEVLRVAFEVAQIFRQAHRVWPARPCESRRRVDVADAGRPCRIVRGVVLRPERFQPEFPSHQPTGDREIGRDEELITHQAMLAGRPPHHPAPAAALPTRTRMGGKWCSRPGVYRPPA